jgi:hypothetical protein
MNDALQNPIELGQLYGYSSSAGSSITVVTGYAKKLTEKKVTLEVKSRRYFLYGEPTGGFANASATVSLHPCHLFPIKQ